MNENKIQIPMKNGRVLVATLNNYDGNHPEITITLDNHATGLVEQDICLVRVHEEEDGASSEDERLDVLVWGDEYNEDYTKKIVIGQYFADKGSDDEEMIDADANDTIVVYSDGACSGNPGPGGWGTVVFKNGKEALCLSGGDPATTNNRMELTGVIEALKHIPDNVPACIKSDSQYVVRGMNEWIDGWVKTNWINSQHKPVVNDDLWRILYDMKIKRKLTFVWVKGHDCNSYNNRCDEMAVTASRRYTKGR